MLTTTFRRTPAVQQRTTQPGGSTFAFRLIWTAATTPVDRPIYRRIPAYFGTLGPVTTVLWRALRWRSNQWIKMPPHEGDEGHSRWRHTRWQGNHEYGYNVNDWRETIKECYLETMYLLSLVKMNQSLHALYYWFVHLIRHHGEGST
jgi:hypothetical protein